MTAAAHAGAPPPGRVLRRALLAWGLGDLELGRRRAAIGWMLAEVVAAAFTAYLVVGLVETTAYLVPFLAGTAFLAVWAVQAAQAYHRARAAQGAIGPAPLRSPAAAMAWLSLPILVWGTGFWLIGGQGATPAAVLDRFESGWSALGEGQSVPAAIADDPAAVTADARAGLAILSAHCAATGDDCGTDPATLLRDLRITITAQDGERASAVAQLVTFERRPSTFLGFIGGTELVPIPGQSVLVFDLRAAAAPLAGGIDVGARRWMIVNAAPAP